MSLICQLTSEDIKHHFTSAVTTNAVTKQVMLCEDVSDPDFWTLARKFEVSKGEMKMPCWVPR